MLPALAVVLLHAHVLTQSPAQPIATALAVVDGRIAYAGDDEAAARRAAGPGAEVIDAAGRTIVPGFNDAHLHFGMSITLGGPHSLRLPELDKRAFVTQLLDAAHTRPANDWIFVTTPALPDGIARARDLDVIPRPVFVATERGGLMNHRALRLCHLTAKEAPDGFIHGRALPEVITRAVASLPERTLIERARAFLAELARVGLTSVQLICDELPDLFETLRKDGQLTARVRIVPYGYRFATPVYHLDWHGAAPDWVRVEGAKYFHDDWARMTRFELKQLYDDATRANRPIVLHVLSRHALQTFLDALTRLSAGHPANARLFRVDHADEVTPDEAAQLARLGITVCSNPSMIPEWRREHAFPMRTLLAAGVKLCIGTDWLGQHTPPRPLAPLTSIALAATHGGFGTSERISAAEALAAYTAGSAAAEGTDGQKGTLTAGRFADLVMLSADPTTTAPERIGEIEVLLTMVGGRVVYRATPLVAQPTIGPPATPAPPTLRGAPSPQPTIGPPRRLLPKSTSP